MRSQINPVVGTIIVVVALAVIGLLIFRGTQGANGGKSGKMESDVDFSKVEKDPVKLQAQLKKDLDRMDAEKGKK